MKWAIYILILATIAAHYALQFKKLDEQRMEFSANSFMELSKIHPVFVKPIQQEDSP